MEKTDDVEEIESDSGDSLIAGSDSDVEDDEVSTLGQEDDSTMQEPLTNQEIEEIIEELFGVESKAAEAQEALEKESLAKVTNEVREELSSTLQGDDLEAAVEEEMNTFKEEWEATLDELESESANLLEQLDGAGVDLPKLYKHIESQTPNGCYTDAWKRRAHWVGSQMTRDANISVTEADNYLKTHRPVQRRHGKMLEAGASGFLQKKLASDGNEEATKGELDWASLRDLFSSSASEDVASFGSKQWASVYLANTPQEAAALGLNLPGVDEVEEIENIDPSCSDPFVADAVANEMQLALSEKQSQNYRKVKEEDDAKLDRKLQLRLRKKRSQNGRKQKHSNDQPYNCDETFITNAHPCDEINVKRSGRNDTNNVNIGNSRSEWVNESCSVPNFSKAGINAEDKDDDDDVKEHKSNHVVIDLDEESINPIDDCEIDNFNNHYGVQQNVHCTACSRGSVDAFTHPLLAVTICEDCRNLLRERALWKDRESSERYCGWCGLGSDFLNCTTCSFLFCYACIKRNLGEDILSKAQSPGWRCCSCCPDMLSGLIYPERKATRSLQASVSSSDSDAEVSNSFIGAETRRKHKKKIRRILDDTELGEETKKKIALEKERQDRLMSLKEQISEKSNATGSVLYGGGGTEVAGIDILGGATTGYIVNVVRERGEPIVRIPCSISANLKAHQVSGIRFLWENIIQSISKVQSGDKGLGCILAHTMGLGKTFQVVAFLYIALRCVDLGLKNALIVTPVNVLHNWRKEFFKWKPSESEIKPLRVYMLEDVARDKRVDLLKKWRRKGGVFLIGYTAFRNLSLGKNIKDRNVIIEISSALQDGPDILVCDEAHIIKNTRADTTQALKLVKCQRRIALTGSPLQNNLMEYYCMVDFVREGFLGSSHEFRNRFQNPIENGQHTNSTAEDVKIMNQRSHILYEQLKGFVQRMDMSVVKKDLPPKTVFVVGVKLSPLQRKLYKRFLDVHGFRKDEASDVRMRKCFFAGYQALAQIWNHPGILQLRKDKDTSNLDGISDGSSDENVDFNAIPGENPRKPRDSTQRDEADEFFEKGWWNDLLHPNNYKEVDYSGKMVLLLEILTMSSNIGDKTLVFSQSIPTLDLIEFYLSRLPRHDKPGSFWKKGRDWFRLDGRTLSSDRQKMVEMFNDPDNIRVKCTLISTRAGSLGINLHAANRVVIVDGSWNPTYDLQAIYRAWRYGQMKPVFAYRLLAHGTMEEKIYKRQVTKEGLAARVVDRQQIHRMISREEMLHLFDFGDEDYSENVATFTHSKKFSPPHGNCSSDKLMETLLAKHSLRWIANHHEHETFLQENEDEKLTKEEQDMAWEVYKRSLEWEEVQRVSHDDRKFQSPDTIVASASPRVDANMVLQSKNVISRRCTKLAHMLTLRSQSVKVGGFTVCGECAQEIRWDDLKKI